MSTNYMNNFDQLTTKISFNNQLLSGLNSGLGLYDGGAIDQSLYQNVDYKVLPNPEIYDIQKKDQSYLQQLELFLKNKADSFKWDSTSWGRIQEQLYSIFGNLIQNPIFLGLVLLILYKILK